MKIFKIASSIGAVGLKVTFANGEYKIVITKHINGSSCQTKVQGKTIEECLQSMINNADIEGYGKIFGKPEIFLTEEGRASQVSGIQVQDVGQSANKPKETQKTEPTTPNSFINPILTSPRRESNPLM